MERQVKSGEIYKHFKGKIYQVICLAKHSETNEEMVVYQALYDDFQIYVRPLSMFISEVDSKKYPDAKNRYRFEKVEKTSLLNQQNQEEKYNDNSKNINQSKSIDLNDDSGCNPYLLEFLEAETIKEKKNILVSIKNKLDDRLINDIAASLDVTVDEGDINTRYDSLMNCLSTMAKYECNRFR